MKRAYTRAEKWLLVLPLLLLLSVLGVQQWQASKPVVLEIPDAKYIEGVVYSPDGKRMAVLSSKPGPDRGYVRFWQIYDVATLTKICDLTAPNHAAKYGTLSWSPDGKRLVATYDGYLEGKKKIPWPSSVPNAKPEFRNNHISHFAVWDVPTGTLVGDYLYAPVDEDSSANLIRYSNDSRKLIGEGTQPSLFDAATGQRLAVLNGTFSEGWSGAFNEKLGLVAVFSLKDKKFQIFDTKTQRVLHQQDTSYVDKFIWQGNILGVKSAGDVLLWDATTRTLLLPPSLRFSTFFEHVAFHAGEDKIAYFDAKYEEDPLKKQKMKTGGFFNRQFKGGDLVVWNYRKNSEVWRVPMSTEVVQVEWLPDGKRVMVLANGTKTIPCRLTVFDSDGKIHFERDITNTSQVSWSPDSRHAAIIVNPPSAANLPADAKEQLAKIEIVDIGE